MRFLSTFQYGKRFDIEKRNTTGLSSLAHWAWDSRKQIQSYVLSLKLLFLTHLRFLAVWFVLAFNTLFLFRAWHFCSEWRKTRLSYFQFSKFPGGACPQTPQAGWCLQCHKQRPRPCRSRSLPKKSTRELWFIQTEATYEFSFADLGVLLGFFYVYEVHIMQTNKNQRNKKHRVYRLHVVSNCMLHRITVYSIGRHWVFRLGEWSLPFSRRDIFMLFL